MSALFIDRFPESDGPEIKLLQLLLSTYQDGSGERVKGVANTLPGFRDFERIVALMVKGTGGEDKHIFDVSKPIEGTEHFYGYSCKSAKTLIEFQRKGICLIEVSNSNQKLWEPLENMGINNGNIKDNDPKLIGRIIISTIHQWYDEVDVRNGGSFIVDNSPLIRLLYDENTLRFQLVVFNKHIPSLSDVEEYAWSINNKRVFAKRPDGKKVFEWYYKSGGQVKYYPLAEEAIWSSDVFYLKPTTDEYDRPIQIKNVLKAKIKQYFPTEAQEIEATIEDLLS